MHRRQILRMRFDNLASQVGKGSASVATATTPRMKPLPASMQAKELPATYTPYPLPKHDEAFEYGPTILRNIPDVHEARRKEMASSRLKKEEDQMDDDVQARLIRGKKLAETLVAERSSYDFAKKPPMPRSVRTAMLAEDPVLQEKLSAAEKRKSGSRTDEAEEMADALFGEMGEGADALSSTNQERSSEDMSAVRKEEEEGTEEKTKYEMDEEEAETLEDIRRLEAFQKKINEAIAGRAQDQRRASTIAAGKDLPAQYQKVDFGDVHENRHRDMTECVKPIPELIDTYKEVAQDRNHDIRHIMTLYDLASTIPRQSKEELLAVLKTVGDQFDVTSQRKISMFERPWMANLHNDDHSSKLRPFYALIDAYRAFHYAIETELMVENPDLLHDVEVLTAVYRLFARTQFRNLNSWYSTSEGSQAFTTTSIAGPTTQRFDFEPAALLWGGMYDAIAGDVNVSETASSSALEGHWLGEATRPQLASLLSAMVAADPNQSVDGASAKRILDVFFEKYEAEVKSGLNSSHVNLEVEAEALGELCLACTVGSISDHRPFVELIALITIGRKSKGGSLTLPALAFSAITKMNNPVAINALFRAVVAEESSPSAETASSSRPYAKELNESLAQLLRTATADQSSPPTTVTVTVGRGGGHTSSSLIINESQLLADRKSYAVARLAMRSVEEVEKRYATTLAELTALADKSERVSESGMKAAEAKLIAADTARGELAASLPGALSCVHPATVAAMVGHSVGLNELVLEYIRGFGKLVSSSLYDDAVGEKKLLSVKEAAEENDDELSLSISNDRASWEELQCSTNPGIVAAGHTSEAVHSTSFSTGIFGANTPIFKDPFDNVPSLRGLKEVVLFHSSTPRAPATILNTLRHANASGTTGLIFTTATLQELQQGSLIAPRKANRVGCIQILNMIAEEAARPEGHVYIVPPTRELLLRGPHSKGDLSENSVLWLARNELARVAPNTDVLVSIARDSKASDPFLSGVHTLAGAAPISSHPALMRNVLDGARYYKGGQHARDNLMYGAYGRPTKRTHGRIGAPQYRPITDRKNGQGAFYHRRMTFWVGKDGGIRDKVRLAPSERFGYGMLQGSPGADIRNMGLYTPDYPTADARLLAVAGASSAESGNWRPSEENPLSERVRNSKTLQRKLERASLE